MQLWGSQTRVGVSFALRVWCILMVFFHQKQGMWSRVTFTLILGSFSCVNGTAVQP